MRHSSVLTVLGTLVLTSACLVTTGTTGRSSAPPPPPPHHEHGGGPPPPPPPRERFLEGMVTDAVTGKPLNKAAVDIVDPASKTMTVQTGPDGHYRTQTLPPGQFSIRCRLDGYEAYQQGYSITDGPARLDCRLQPKHR